MMKRTPGPGGHVGGGSGSLVVFSALLLALAGGCGGKDKAAGDEPLLCHVGETMQPVMAELAKRYEAKTGRKVTLNTAGSSELLEHIKNHKIGDLYVCHDPFGPLLMKKTKTGADGWMIAEVTPVIVVQKGNPKNIHTVKDLTNPALGVWLTDYEYSSLGWMLPTIFRKAGVDFEKEVKQAKHIQTMRKGAKAANRVTMRNADAAIVWDAVAYLRRADLDIIKIPAEALPTPKVDTVTSATIDPKTGKNRVYPLRPMRVTIATLACAKQPKEAEKFAEFVASEEGNKVFREFGYMNVRSEKLWAGGKPLVAIAQSQPSGKE